MQRVGTFIESKPSAVSAIIASIIKKYSYHYTHIIALQRYTMYYGTFDKCTTST